MSTVQSLIASSAAADRPFQSLSRPVALDRARQFLQQAGRRAAGPSKFQLDPVSDASGANLEALSDMSDAAGDGRDMCWIAMLEATPLADAVAVALRAVPAEMSDVLLLAHVQAADERIGADHAAFCEGFRRHPLLFTCVTYAGLEDEAGWLVLPYERVAEDVLARYPVERLSVESGLHMDMTRAAGPRADAHLARYRFASGRLPVDARVLDAACGFGYGSALLTREAPRRVVTGLDIADWVVEYAAASYGDSKTGPTFRRADVCDLNILDDAGFDAVVSFETLEHLLEPERFLREIRRVLATGGALVASVPYRWIEDGDTGATHHDWFDARKLIALIERFLTVEELWVQTAGRGRFSEGFRRELRRCQRLGEEPHGDVEWLIVVARKRAIPSPDTHPWLFVTPGVPELATMAASIEAHGGLAGGGVIVVDQGEVADDERAEAYQAACEAWGFCYHGRIGGHPSLEDVGDPLEFRPSPDAASEEVGRRVRTACPILDDFVERAVVMAVRPQVAGDVALLQGLRARETHVVGHAMPADYGVRDLTGVPGLANNPLALLPSDRIVSPPWMAAAVAGDSGVGSIPTCVDALVYARVLRALTTVRPVQDWCADIGGRSLPYETLLLCEPLASDGLTAPEAVLTFYLHQVRLALRRTRGSVLVRPHPDEAPPLVRSLETRLTAESDRVRVMHGPARYFPVGLWQSLVDRVETLQVWGGSAVALAETSGWPGVCLTTVDADYLEPEVRRRARQALASTSRVRGLSLRISDDVLTDEERAGLFRRWRPSPAEARVEEWRAKVRQIDDERRAARVRVEDTMLRLLEAEERIRQGDIERARTARHVAFCEELLRAGAARTWIWGTGAGGQGVLRHLRELGVEPAGFLDGRAHIEPRVIDGLSVYAADQVPAAREAGALIIIASMYAEDILRRMRTEGHWTARTLTWTE